MSYNFHLEQADIMKLGMRILVQFFGFRGGGDRKILELKGGLNFRFSIFL